MRLGIYEQDYSTISSKDATKIEQLEMKEQTGNCAVLPQDYPKSYRYSKTIFPNNYLDPYNLREKTALIQHCKEFKTLLDRDSTKELDIKRFIQDNGYYHIPASILCYYDFGHHEAYLFKEFALGSNYRADYLIIGKNSMGYHFIWVEFEAVYSSIVTKDERFVEAIRKGIDQIDDWKSYLQQNYSSITAELKNYTKSPSLPIEFTNYDSTRMYYVVVVGRRSDFSNEESGKANEQRRRKLQESQIRILHYDNLYDKAIELTERGRL